MMSDLNHRLDEEIRKGKYVEEALKRNTSISSPIHEEEPPAPIEEEADTDNMPENREQVAQPQTPEPRGEQEQPATAVTDTAQDNLQEAQQQDDKRPEGKGTQINLGGVPGREQENQGASTGGPSTSDSTVTAGSGNATHAGEVNSRDRGSVSASDINETGGEPPTGGSDKQ
ncbi:hypothetical protein [Dictyobacter kobayashii]|uniref:Uncharacterized protein n=1 Tax=Dictyobacter kobayashii TaxID=2014872 RepID=A0A402AQ26_9CHLR|nr:hypothetical protein [Dictyobacter kobayashii]GCE21227.1 hypothetical protein KDK_50270 [Dictyobacter kobayashii]